MGAAVQPAQRGSGRASCGRVVVSVAWRRWRGQRLWRRRSRHNPFGKIRMVPNGPWRLPGVRGRQPETTAPSAGAVVVPGAGGAAGDLVVVPLVGGPVVAVVGDLVARDVGRGCYPGGRARAGRVGVGDGVGVGVGEPPPPLLLPLVNGWNACGEGAGGLADPAAGGRRAGLARAAAVVAALGPEGEPARCPAARRTTRPWRRRRA